MTIHRLRLAIAQSLVLPALWLGCTDDPVTSDPDLLLPEERVHELRFTQWPGVSWAGMSVPFRLEALDSAGAGVAGATLQFELAEARGSLSAASLVTDSLGRAEVEIAIDSAGGNGLIATVRGRDTSVQWYFEALPRPRVRFYADSLRLPGSGCQGTLYAQVLDEGDQLILASSVDFVATNPGILAFYSLTVTGNYRSMTRGVVGETAGTTSVIATHASGAADTAVVTVDADVLRVVSIVEAEHLELGDYALPGDLATPLPGDTLRWGLWSANECGRRMAVPVEWVSTDPAVASVDSSGTVTIGGHGHALVIASAEGLADTVKVETRQVEPRDTTIAVGDTVQYRLSIADAGGVLHPTTDFWAQPGGDVVASAVMIDGKPSARVVGVAPGSTSVRIISSPPFRSASVRLKVVDR